MSSYNKSSNSLFSLERKSSFLDEADTVAFTVFLDDERTDKMKFYAPIFKSGSIEDWLEWMVQLELTIQQKNVTEDDTEKSSNS